MTSMNIEAGYNCSGFHRKKGFMEKEKILGIGVIERRKNTDNLM